jgi:signal transduction histidine kinase
MAQNADDQVTDIGNQLEQLNDCLNDLEKELNECETIKEVSQVAVKFIREELKSQAAFIFLFDKDGLLTRVAIEGEDRNGKLIADDWLYDEDIKKAEHYKPGESFSGRQVPNIGDDRGFGIPQYSTNLQDNDGGITKYKYGKQYLEKLGELKSGISVPLNGFSRTFGLLDVMNKQDAQGLTEFTEEDVYFLMLISTLVASHISNIGRQHRTKIYVKLTDWLFKSSSKSVKFKEVCEYLAKELISETTPYKVCIIRKVNEDDFFEDLAKESTPDIIWEKRKSGSLKIDRELNTITAKVYREKKPEYVENIPQAEKERSNEFIFHNSKWLDHNNLKSIAVLPLTAGERTFGTFTVSVSYEHKFSEGNKAFLENLAHILASIFAANQAKKELMEQKSELAAISQQIGSDSMMQNFLHQYKNELIEFSLILSQLSGQSNKSNKFKEQMIYERKQWIEHRIEEIKQEFQGNSQELSLFNINQKIKEITNLFLADEPDIDLEASYDPDIPEIEVKSSEIEAVIYNLINNAVIAINNAKPKQKRLTVATNLVTISRIDYIEIVVQDNGNGIPNEISDQVFKKGFSTRQEQGGTGRGLFIAKEVIDNYGGKISFESKVGQGTTFKVYIPYRRYVP